LTRLVGYIGRRKQLGKDNSMQYDCVILIVIGRLADFHQRALVGSRFEVYGPKRILRFANFIIETD
jgi:hypothetical protein